MWKLYGDAIQSTKKQLMKAFDVAGSSVTIAPVTYFDYSLKDLTTIPKSSEEGLPEEYKLMITPELCFKRKSFEHERELRVMTWDPENTARDVTGKHVSVNIEAMLGKVYVSPLAPDWVADVVSREMNHYGLSTQKIVHSKLYSERLA